MDKDNKITICIVEDFDVILDSLKALINGEPDFKVAGAYASAEEALQKNDWEKTDILLVDMKLPGMSGVDLIRRVSPPNPNLRIVAYTDYDQRKLVVDALKAGACGYLIKGESYSDLIAGLHKMYDGGNPMSPGITRILLDELRTKTQPDPDKRIPTLTERERTILRHLDNGLAHKEIADRLSIAVSTVHTHIKNMYGKFEVKNRAEAIRKGRYYNII